MEINTINDVVRLFNELIDNTPIKEEDNFICPNCKKSKKYIVDNNIYYVCLECGDTIIRQDYFSYHNNGFDHGSGACIKKSVYKREGYLETLLNRIQNRNKKVNIDAETLAAIKKKTPKDMTELKKILKEMGLPKYYKHGADILRLCDRKTLLLQPLTINQVIHIKDRFNEIQEKFRVNDSKYNKRHNFLNYNFVICQLLKEIGRDDYCCMIPVSKNKALLEKYNDTWNLLLSA